MGERISAILPDKTEIMILKRPEGVVQDKLKLWQRSQYVNKCINVVSKSTRFNKLTL